MTLQKGVCEECKMLYEFEFNPKYPRKYCQDCSAKKKADFEGKTITPTPIVEQEAPNKEEKRDVVRAVALTKIAFQSIDKPNPTEVLDIYKYFLENL